MDIAVDTVRKVEGSAAVTGLVAGTPVLTLEGALPVDYLSPGDRILTRSGTRVLRAIEVSLVSNARLVRIGAETLGVDIPADDILVAAGQPVLVRDWRARALFGAAAALVEAARLTDGEYIRAETVAEARVYTLHFDAPAVIYAGGLEIGCPGVAVPA